jgi:hypothetical protein
MPHKPWLSAGVSRARGFALVSFLSVATLICGAPAFAESSAEVDVVTLAGPSEERPAQAYVAQDDVARDNVARDNTGHGPATLTVSPLGELVVSPANATNPTGVAQSLEKDTVPELLPLRPFVASWAAAASHHAAVAPAPEHRTLSHGVLDLHPIELEAADDTQADALTIPAGTVTIGGLRTTAPSAASASAAQPGTAEQPSATQKTGTAQKTGDSTSTEQQAKHVSITVKAASKSWTYDGEEHSDADVSLVSGTLKSGDVLEAEVDGTVTDVADTAAGNNVVKSAKVLRGEGGRDVSGEYDITLVPGTLSVTKRNVLLTSPTAEKAYDGEPIDASEVQVSGDGFARGEGANVTMTNPRTEVGTSMNEFSYELTQGTDANNYSISTVLGTQSVYTAAAQHRIDVKGRSAEFTYDGTEKSVSGIEKDTFEFDGKTYKVSGYTAEAKATNAGDYTVNVLGTPVVTDAEGHDVSSEFDLHVAPGKLTIKHREATVKPDDLEKTEGDADPQLKATVEGLVGHDKVDYKLSSDGGESAGTYTIRATGNARQGNYDVKFENGELTINAKQSPDPTPQAASYSFTEGADGTWTRGTEEPARFTIERNPNSESTFSHFTTIAVDGQGVASEDYGVESGSVKLAIGSAYLDSLAAGEHTLTAYFDDGQVEAKFTIAEGAQPEEISVMELSRPTVAPVASVVRPVTPGATAGVAKPGTPQTGDIPLVEGAAALAVVAGVVIIAAVVAKRRKSE